MTGSPVDVASPAEKERTPVPRVHFAWPLLSLHTLNFPRQAPRAPNNQQPLALSTTIHPTPRSHRRKHFALAPKRRIFQRPVSRGTGPIGRVRHGKAGAQTRVWRRSPHRQVANPHPQHNAVPALPLILEHALADANARISSSKGPMPWPRGTQRTRRGGANSPRRGTAFRGTTPGPKKRDRHPSLPKRVVAPGRLHARCIGLQKAPLP